MGEATPDQKAQSQRLGGDAPEGGGEERAKFQRQESSMETARWAFSLPSGFH